MKLHHFIDLTYTSKSKTSLLTGRSWEDNFEMYFKRVGYEGVR